jgi:outer membrane protein
MSAVDLERQKAQQEFESKAASLDDSGKQALGEKLSQQVAKREQDLMGPIQKKVQKAIATVAKRAGINSVVDSSAMLYGGKDLTGDVIAEVLK